MPQLFANSSWGRPCKELDTRVLRSYRRLLVAVANAGEILNHALLVALIATTAWLLIFMDLENVIPYDGTATTCVLEGTTLGTSNVQ